MYPGVFTDQLSRQIFLAKPPLRIISLVPSHTEMLFDLGLADQIVGITRFCIHPSDRVRSKTRVGGTKQLDLATIIALKPDLLIANKEENSKADIEALVQAVPVWISDINTLTDAYNMILSIGEITDRKPAAEKMVTGIREGFNSLNPEPALRDIRVAYFIWRKPYMLAGKSTFIDHILELAGFTNATDLDRYPEVTPEAIRQLNPDVIFLSSEPYPFSERHLMEFQDLCPQVKVVFVDGEMFSWYGSRLLHTSSYLTKIISEKF